MTQINKIRRKSGGHISYKFYGKELSAGFDVKFIIDNHNILKNAFTPVPKIVTMKHLDELRLFFLAKKISDMEKIIPYINSNENKGKKGNIRDYASMHQLLILANLESYNAILTPQFKNPSDRLPLLRKIVVKQLKALSVISPDLPKLLG